jgi:hypothetical protein
MLLLLSGWKGSGKDTAADYLVRKHGFIKLSFASALKDMVSEAYCIPRHYFDDRTLKEKALPQFPAHFKDGFSDQINQIMASEMAEVGGELFHTPRSLCILEGSVKRSVDPNYWVKRATRGLDPKKNYVIADWRYRSEFEALKDLNPVTVRINRFESTTSTDPSERDLDNFAFDTVIGNVGTVDDLHYDLGTAIKKEAA